MPVTVRQRSIHAKNGAKKPIITKGKRLRKGSEGEYLVTNAPTDLRSIGYPGGVVALLLLCVARIGSSYFGIINDCDETYNYWEPLHYLLYGSGLQTWEYSPVYAIRSYMPLWVLVLPVKMLAYICSPVIIFYALRVFLAVCTAAVELVFYKAICSEFGINIGRMWLGLTLTAAGSFISSSALLPSSWSGILTTLALAAWWKNEMHLAVGATAVNTLLSWPFAALTGFPIAIDMLLVRPKVKQFIKYSLISLVAVLLPMIAVDSFHYGRIVIAPLNIVKYNVFSEHGPDLYGTEPWTFYFVNGFLNFNVVWFLSLSCPVVLLGCEIVTRDAAPRPAFCVPYWLSLMPLYLWLAVFVTQPHKEERFLFPVYSMVVLCAAICIDSIQKLLFGVWRLLRGPHRVGGHYLRYTAPIMWFAFIIAGLGGLSRIISLVQNYSAPMTILRNLPDVPHERTYVCFGKEWYRSPSSFHLPHPDYRIRFIESEFKGQLPAPYNETFFGSQVIHGHFNDANKRNSTTYLQPKQCHYLVDSDLGTPTKLEPSYANRTNTWEVIGSNKIIDSSKSAELFRAFYVPVLSDKYNVFSNMYLLRNKKLT